MIATSKLVISGGKTSSWFFFERNNIIKQTALARRLLQCRACEFPIQIRACKLFISNIISYFELPRRRTVQGDGYKQTVQSQSQQSSNHKVMCQLVDTTVLAAKLTNACQQIPAGSVLLIRLVTFIFGLWTVQTELYKNVGKDYETMWFLNEAHGSFVFRGNMQGELVCEIKR